MTDPVPMEERPYVKALLCDCALCGQVFIQDPWHLVHRRPRRYCSKKCKDRSNAADYRRRRPARKAESNRRWYQKNRVRILERLRQRRKASA